VLTAALPSGALDAHAVTEQTLAHDPQAALSADHVAVLWLEPTGTHEGDTGTAEGVDRVPYFFAQQTLLTLRMHENADQVQQLVLQNHQGHVLARSTQDAPSTTVLLQPGAHFLHVHHARQGDAAAPGQQVFLRPLGAPPPAAAAGPSPGQAAGESVAIIEASQDCPLCNFANTDLSGHDFSGLDLHEATFSGADLSQAKFHSANLTAATFSGANLSEASFLQAIMVGANLQSLDNIQATVVTKTVFVAANLTGARFDGVQKGVPEDPGPFFTHAILDSTTWAPVQFRDIDGTMTIKPAHLENAVFSEASLKNATFDFTSLDGSIFTFTVLEGTDFRTTANFDNVFIDYPPLHGDKTTSCFQCDFQASTITTTHFEGAVLEGAIFKGARFAGTHFDGVVLTGADFSIASFAGQDLSRLDLSTDNGVVLSAETNFTGAIFSDGVAHGVNLAGQVLPNAGTILKGQNLAFVNLSRMALPGIDLQSTNLSHANLTGTDLSAANLEGADLSNAILVGAVLNFANFRHARLQGIQAGAAPGNSSQATSFKGAYMPSVDLTDADLRSADLSDAHLYGDATTGPRLLRTKLDSADLGGAILSGTAFSGSLTDAVFNKAVLVNCTFNEANLANAKFDDAYLQGANFTGASSVSRASFINAAFSTAGECLAGSGQRPPCEWQYTEQDGTPVIVSYGATVLGTLATDSTVLCPNGEQGGGQTPGCSAKLRPADGGPFPPKPACIPLRPRYCNCIPVDEGGCAPN
jgi:uncharacterized protein YjbI with pentapeptide repeats